MKFKELYLINGRWATKTMIRVRINETVEDMTAYDARRKYGEKLVSAFYDDDVTLV